MKLDILVLAAHPDDAELSCSGTILSHIAQGYKVGIVDLTRGELGTRGSAELRDQEAVASAKIMGLSVRENLAFEDGFFQNDRQHQLEVVKVIRKYRPEIVLCNAQSDRHPDHGKGGELAKTACFLAGLPKIETTLDGEKQEAWRPKNLYQYIQSNYIQPDFVVDCSDFWEKKVAAIRAFSSQFHTGAAGSDEGPQTFISTPGFIDFINARGREFGQHIGVQYAEGFTTIKLIGVKNIFDLS
ncbi:bacillithiol biosynthesis deacetylase BshB1 [Persicobacter sp. CCB-QB2]|uniref:bacillithiol biosynthesis deacetylase BshB1 n=1 Tax=Persicobacter sp. CCB-QB2 TaxID=1561025 RepID=UPI0006A94A1F|nr:bacillithiol biosynthesis deacetylase BshB1 [Persicobacter sp. CCB-QB2]